MIGDDNDDQMLMIMMMIMISVKTEGVCRCHESRHRDISSL
jgi:hypothetical protein